MAHLTFRTLATAVFISALAPSSLAAADAPGSETFTGTCEMSGVIRHQPPLTQTPALTTVRGSFSGTCSGELTDSDGGTRRIDGVPAEYNARGVGQLSCLGGTATGTGALTFAGGQAIDFSLTERRPAPGVATVVLEGAAGGTATVFGTVSSSEDPVEINERCNGSGLRVVHADARIVSPGISG